MLSKIISCFTRKKTTSEKLVPTGKPFVDQKVFMEACDQTTTTVNDSQSDLYFKLIEEELLELKEAIKENNEVEKLDAVIDILVVVSGYGLSRGFDMDGAWKEVMKTNFAKIGNDGKVAKREDGKVMKPEGWVPPDLTKFVNK